MEFAYAMGHSRTIGRDPRLEWVVERVAELQREIEALTQEPGDGWPRGGGCGTAATRS